jgi:N-acetylmuramoyl-L-alanine amidase
MPVTGSELAAVSREPGRIAGTAHPTSQPIVSNAAPPPPDTFAADANFNHDAIVEHAHAATPVPAVAHTTTPAPTAATETSGHPIAAAPPTSTGETSLVRALGLKINRIVIDAGHGGHDSGTLGVGGIREKDVVLDVALRLGKLLHDRLGAEITYTRSDDTFVALETRTAIANKAQADLFISVHANSSPEAAVRGVEVYYLNFTSDPDAMRVAARENAVSSQSVHDLSDLVKKIALKDKIDESKELATDVDSSLFTGLEKGNVSLHNRGVKKAPFVVLIGANMPSILAEISFVTNQQDAAELEKPEYRERVAESLYTGIAHYADAINGHKSRPAPTQRAAR